jgi:hypothetical protein
LQLTAVLNQHIIDRNHPWMARSAIALTQERIVCGQLCFQHRLHGVILAPHHSHCLSHRCSPLLWAKLLRTPHTKTHALSVMRQVAAAATVCTVSGRHSMPYTPPPPRTTTTISTEPIRISRTPHLHECFSVVLYGCQVSGGARHPHLTSSTQVYRAKLLHVVSGLPGRPSGALARSEGRRRLPVARAGL